MSDTNIDKDEAFLDVGCSNHESIIPISDDEAAWMSYKGPFETHLRQARAIGQDLSEWWEETLSVSDLESCVGAYNYKKDQLWFFFPNYTDSDFPTGIIFVYDRKARALGYNNVWYYFKSDHAALASLVNDDADLLTNDGTDIVNWNSGTEAETVSTVLRMLLLEGPERSKRKQTLFKWIYVEGTFGDTITARIYLDGSGTPVNLSLSTTTYEAFIRYLAETFELEIISSASTNDIEYKRIQIALQPKSF